MNKFLPLLTPLAILLGILCGLWTGTHTELFGLPLVRVYSLIGQLFLNALTLVVIPLVIASMIAATCRLSQESGFAFLGKRTLLTFFLISLLGALTGIICLTLFSPGSNELSPIVTPSTLEQASLFDTVEQIALNIIPSNLFSTAAKGQLLGLIGFCLLFGAFIPHIQKKSADILFHFFEGCFFVLMEMTKKIMLALPLGAFGLVAKAAAEIGFDAVASVLWFLVATLFALSLFSFVILPLLLHFFAKISPLAFYAALTPALVTAFTTSSSAACLPTLLECLEEKTKIPSKVFGMTVPLGASMSLAGTALYIAAVTLFVAQVSHLSLSMQHLGLIALLATVTSMGMAGIPSASLVSIIVILQTLNLPAEALGLILAVERILDMCRTSVNVLGNATSAALISKKGVSA